MFLVADSGSTKASWILIDKGKVVEEFNTPGFNPHFHDEAYIFSELDKVTQLKKHAPGISMIFFYGAGCSGEPYNSKISGALKKFFPGAEVYVDHDIMASAIATCGDQEGISCILGTGSNVCYYDGKQAHKSNFGLGFILGDEGSGSYYGKKLIAYYLYGMLPENIKSAFEKRYVMGKDIMIRNVYNNPNANVWLASFAQFFTELKEDAWVKEMVRKGMDEFLTTNVCNFKNVQNLKVHFVGSIAHFFEDILRTVATEKGIAIGKVIRHPIDELAKYYIRKYPSA